MTPQEPPINVNVHHVLHHYLRSMSTRNRLVYFLVLSHSDSETEVALLTPLKLATLYISVPMASSVVYFWIMFSPSNVNCMILPFLILLPCLVSLDV